MSIYRNALNRRQNIRANNAGRLSANASASAISCVPARPGSHATFVPESSPVLAHGAPTIPSSPAPTLTIFGITPQEFDLRGCGLSEAISMSDHLPECPKSGCEACYEQGQRDAIAAAVQRIKALPWTSYSWLAYAERAAIIAAIKGDNP
jgi:hypothetical protein